MLRCVIELPDRKTGNLFMRINQLFDNLCDGRVVKSDYISG